MLYLSKSEWLFWGGIAVMTVSAVLMVLCVAVFLFTGGRIRKKLEQEYGKPQG